MKQYNILDQRQRENATPRALRRRLNARRRASYSYVFCALRRKRKSMMMAKNREQYSAVRIIGRERKRVCKRAFWQLCIFVQLDRSPMSHVIFFPHLRSFSREKKSARNASKRANERVDLQKQNSRRPSPFITIRSVLVVVRASEKEEHVG